MTGAERGRGVVACGLCSIAIGPACGGRVGYAAAHPGRGAGLLRIGRVVYGRHVRSPGFARL